MKLVKCTLCTYERSSAFCGAIRTMDNKYLRYEDFGAIGDGKTDDFAAIISCHEEANRTGTPVKCTDGAKYYIGGKDASAIIKTDVDFGTAEFIIDDRKLERIQSYVFSVQSDNPTLEITIPSINRGQDKLDIGLSGSYYVRVYNDEKNIFIRKGLNMNNGTATQDCFIVDTDGNIYPSVDWDYPVVTRATARCADDKPITIKGGIFKTIANQEESFYRYHQRGFEINRSHVTICDFKHYVEGELDHGAPYHGFIRTNEAYDVTIKDATITPRFIYRTASKIPGKDVPMGSYDLSFFASIDVRCINVHQTIDINDERYWGIYTSNFCKNLYLENCTFSRFDAHQGVTNVTIRNCRLGHQNIQLIGFGEFIMENTEVYSRWALVSLRGDYGSTFNGNITVKNCVWIHNGNNNAAIIAGNNTGDHDYGYTCFMGKNILVDGLKVINENKIPDKMLFALNSYDGNYEPGKPFAYVTPETVTVKNVTLDEGFTFAKTANDNAYTGTAITTKEVF